MYVLGIDVGTTGTKALLMDENGRVAAKAYKGYELITGPGGVVEQDPEAWWDAVVAVVRETTSSFLDKSQIIALSISAQGASSVLLDAHKRPCGNALTWLDTRSVEEKHQLAAFYPNDRIYKMSGWPLNEALDAAKLLWYRNHRRNEFDAASGFVSTMEYIIQKLTGEVMIDPANGAIRQLMDIKSSCWDEELLDFIGFPLSKMPIIAPTGTLAGNLTCEAAEETGLNKKTHVYLGAHDQYCVALGSGLIEPGQMLLSTGTAWVMLGITSQPMFTPSCIASARHVVEGTWGAIADFPAGGVSLEWFKKIAPDDYSIIDENAATRMEKARDILFYPYFSGAWYPLWQSEAKGTFIGLSLNHDGYDIYRAIMEGVAFQVKLGIDDFRSNGAQIDKLSVAGGATKSALWLDIITAATGVEIYTSEETDAACVGAAMIAAVGEGMLGNYSDAAKVFLRPKTKNTVNKGMVDIYSEKFSRYRDAWKDISKVYS